jgi:hypothetical protein
MEMAKVEKEQEESLYTKNLEDSFIPILWNVTTAVGLRSTRYQSVSILITIDILRKQIPY